MLDTIKVVIFAQPGELDNIKRRLENTVPDGVLRNFDYIAEYQDMSIVQHIDETIELGPQLVIVDQRVTKFTFDHIHRLTHERAKIGRAHV